MENKKEMFILKIEDSDFEDFSMLAEIALGEGALEIFSDSDIENFVVSLHQKIKEKFKGNEENIKKFYLNFIDKVDFKKENEISINIEEFLNDDVDYCELLKKITKEEYPNDYIINVFLEENKIYSKVNFRINDQRESIIYNSDIEEEEIKALFEFRNYYNAVILDEKGEVFDSRGPVYIDETIFNTDLINEKFEFKFEEDYTHIITKEDEITAESFDFDNVPKIEETVNITKTYKEVK